MKNNKYNGDGDIFFNNVRMIGIGMVIRSLWSIIWGLFIPNEYEVKYNKLIELNRYRLDTGTKIANEEGCYILLKEENKYSLRLDIEKITTNSGLIEKYLECSKDKYFIESINKYDGKNLSDSYYEPSNYKEITGLDYYNYLVYNKSDICYSYFNKKVNLSKLNKYLNCSVDYAYKKSMGIEINKSSHDNYLQSKKNKKDLEDGMKFYEKDYNDNPEDKKFALESLKSYEEIIKKYEKEGAPIKAEDYEYEKFK